MKEVVYYIELHWVDTDVVFTLDETQQHKCELESNSHTYPDLLCDRTHTCREMAFFLAVGGRLEESQLRPSIQEW